MELVDTTFLTDLLKPLLQQDDFFDFALYCNTDWVWASLRYVGVASYGGVSNELSGSWRCIRLFDGAA